MSNPDQIKTQKEQIIEEFKKTPIILVVCQKIGIGRTTYYRWVNEDINFAKFVEEAIRFGIQTVNDYAESKLIANIQKGDNTAIIYWLKHNHQKYKEAYLGLNPILQKQLINLLDQNETQLLKQILGFVISQKLSTKMAGKLITVINKYFKAKSTERKKKEYEVLSSLITNLPMN